ncbi:serine/threonine protein kinase, CMGC family, CDC2/CDK subfamily [Tothia fuscella]|uniref:cyclin-dependent kinase n=1 Tax=Tothia fuscella TaxID=1048955 RepID=A0A9P4TUH0_9PEZI|nr:serine/threonine protein kinase, CMGC family, CDC2/CDK subfamily [Tothia fuscella]
MTGKSRWGNDEADAAARKKEKEEKKRVKLEKQRKVEEEEARRRDAGAAPAVQEQDSDRPSKRRKVSEDEGRDEEPGIDLPRILLRFTAPEWAPCRHIDNFERLNHIEEGSYGWVSRARESATGEIVALKKLKMDNLNDGFPVTALREIQTLKESRHKHIVDLREVVMGDTLTDVFLVMDFLEHDLKTLQEDMTEPFLQSEIKTLMLQLTSAVEYLHDHWILHRDLKTSNILMNNRGELKVADFGMARYFGDPAPANMTQLVVTLWYRAPELLLGAESYGRGVDIWSLGCIFGELLKNAPILPGKNEVDELSKIFELCGLPSEETWPGFRRLPNAKGLRLPRTPTAIGSVIRSKFPLLTAAGTDLLNSLLALNPAHRPSAADVLNHPWFSEDPRPKATAMFPTFPSKAGQEKRRRVASPSAPKRGDAPKINGEGLDFSGIFADREAEEVGAGFALRLG